MKIMTTSALASAIILIGVTLFVLGSIPTKKTILIGCGSFIGLLGYVCISVIAGVGLVAAGYFLTR